MLVICAVESGKYKVLDCDVIGIIILTVRDRGQQFYRCANMRGIIISQDQGAYLISGDDGRRYQFATWDWLGKIHQE